MRFNILLLLLLSTFYQSKAQRKSQSEKDEAFYLYQIESYHKMQKAGLMMGISGGAMTIFGSAMISAANNNSELEHNDRTSLGVIGVISIVVGVPIGITGIVISTIGSRKLKQNKGKLEQLSIDTYADPNVQGVALKYRF